MEDRRKKQNEFVCVCVCVCGRERERERKKKNVKRKKNKYEFLPFYKSHTVHCEMVRSVERADSRKIFC